jgi:uncharacterized membrane protein
MIMMIMIMIMMIMIIIICLLKDVAESSDSNIIQRDAESKVKYKNLSIEIQIIWYRK